MNLQWVQHNEIDPEIAQSYAKRLNVPSIISSILISRGIDTFDKAKRFFKGKVENLYDPFLLNGMKQAVERITTAINNKEKILIYGDDDVDGITFVSLLYLLLQKLGAEVFFYIPHRIQEGYGIAKSGIDEAKKKGVRIIISVDCGITDIKEVE